MNKIRCFLSLFLIGCFSILLNAQHTETDEGRTMGFDFSCDKIEIHPSVNDFEGSYGSILNAGKILISTIHDDVYYTKYQEHDAQVNIVVDVPLSKVGENVYFRIVTQNGEEIDPDDLSPYEDDLGCDDNNENAEVNDNVGEKGTLSNGGIAEAMFSQDGSYGVATVILSITNQYAGDNYQVEASLDENFASGVVKTTILEAWKRIYLEVDEMYKKGATIVESSNINSNNAINTLVVDNTTDFMMGTEVEVFSPDGTLAESGVIDEVTNSNVLMISGFQNSFTVERFYGVKIKDENETFSVPISYSGLNAPLNKGALKEAYGWISSGMDGGAFVEVVRNSIGHDKVPKYTNMPTNNIATLYATTWRVTSQITPPTYSDNLFQIIPANQDANGISLGFTVKGLNISYTFYENHTFGNKNEIAIEETLAHELGHQFSIIPVWADPNETGVRYPHVDVDETDPLYNSHDCKDHGLMSGGRDREDDIAEFYIECINHIRNLVDPIE